MITSTSPEPKPPAAPGGALAMLEPASEPTAVTPPTGLGTWPLALLAAGFFASGAAGLVYQVVWQRILALHTGVGIYSVAMIVAAFMAGLGLGSHVGGVLSARVAPRRALALFASLELTVAAFGAASCALYYDVLYLKASWLYQPAWRAGLLQFAGLAAPTLLMGMTLPFLVRATLLDVARAERTVGVLYGLNVLGAAVGAFLAPWVLIRFTGLRGAVLVAAGLNVCAALAAFAVARWLVPTPPPAVAAQAPEVTRDTARHPFALWATLYALSGGCALALEVVWFRLLDLAVKSTAFTFGTLLAFYLLGLGLGCLGGIPLAARSRRPLRAFLLCQCALLVYAACALGALVRLPVDAPFVAWLHPYWSQRVGFGLGAEWSLPTFLRLYVLLPLYLFGPPTLLMGLSFPFLQKAVHDDPRTAGRKVGLLQAANIAGCVAGSLLVGLLALAHLGSSGSLRALAAGGVVFAAVGWRRTGSRALFAGLALASLLAAAAVPGQALLWRRLHGTEDPRALTDEDATAVGALVPTRQGRWSMFVNGTSHSWIPYGGIHTELGAVPALVHPAPLDVAVIGLGSGDTAWAAACRKDTRSVSVYEIAGPQPRLLARLASEPGMGDVRRLLSDPRVRIHIADGRHAVTRGERLYDIIEADALRPHAAYAGNVYSVEFFRECAARLKPGGLMSTWVPTGRVHASFTEVFPYVLKAPRGAVFIGSLQPIALDRAAWLARLDAAEVQEYLGAQPSQWVRKVLEQLAAPHKSQRFVADDLNLDLYPRDEFQLP